MDYADFLSASSIARLKMLSESYQQQQTNHILAAITGGPGYIQAVIDGMKAKEERLKNFNALTSQWKEQVEMIIYSVKKKHLDEKRGELFSLELIASFLSGGKDLVIAELHKIGFTDKKAIDSLLDDFSRMRDKLDSIDNQISVLRTEVSERETDLFR